MTTSVSKRPSTKIAVAKDTLPAPDGETADASAVLYVRVSTKEQAERDGDPDGYSIPAQLEACRRKATALGAVVVEEFVERGESARTVDRPEIQRLLRYVRDNAVTYVIVHKIDRLARNRVDDVAIGVELKACGVQLVSVSENIDETPSGILLHGIMSSIAEFYSRNLANEVIKGSTQKAKQGGTPMKAPTGYLNVRRVVDGREVRTVDIDPVRGPIMAWAFDAYATGKWTLRALLDEVTQRGLDSTPGPRTASKPLGLSHFHRLLRHPYYMGIVRYREVLYAGKHEPLVSAETWQTVQELLAANNTAGERKREHPHYLKGSVYCGTCGSRLIVSHAKNRWGTIYEYFLCIGRQQRRTDCTQRAIRIDDTETAIANHYATVRLTPEQAEQVRDYVLDELLQLRTESEHHRAVQTRRLRKLQDERKKLLDAHYADAIPLELLKTEQARITTAITSAQQQLDALDNDAATAQGNLHKALALVQDCETAYRDAPPALRRQFNQAFFKRLIVDDTFTVTGELAEPFAILLSDDIREAAHEHAEQRNRPEADPLGDTATEPDEPVLALVGAGLHRQVKGLNKKTMVGDRGLEPPTSCV
jgi:site-specific DNA recombinase